MSVEDKLEAIMIEVRTIREITNKLDERINGNGRPGFIERIATVESRIHEAEKNKAGLLAVIASFIAALGSAFTYMVK
jgi:hypothetical protein